jgi:hypothetical protein
MENSKKILDANFAKSMDDNIELVQSKRINKSNRDITAAKENSNSQETYNLPRENRNLNFKLYKYEDKREIAGKLLFFLLVILIEFLFSIKVKAQ